MVASYLIEQGLYEAAKGFSGMEPALMELVYTRLITPKEYQQKAAKRRGHGCEAALAAVLQACGLHIRPESKATNPMGSTDPHINLSSMDISERTVGTTHAFDMVVLAKSRLRIGIQCLIHTSDPGQYGVDKSNETVQIADKINTWNARHAKTEQVELWGLVDGVGFSENKPDTINKLLRNFHYFIQLNTLYKGPLRAHALGLTTIKAIRFSTYYDSEDIASIRSLYVPDNVTLLSEADSPPSGATAIPAGEATIYV